MAARSRARTRALDVLFEAELRGEPVLEILSERTADGAPPVPAYAAELVAGVQAHRPRIDELLAGHSHGWALERMPGVDRNILRIGAYELLWRDDIPPARAVAGGPPRPPDLSPQGAAALLNT